MSAKQVSMPFVGRCQDLKYVEIVVRAYWSAAAASGEVSIYTPKEAVVRSIDLKDCADCNEAHYRTAIWAMEIVLASLGRRGLKAKDYQLVVRSNNRLMIGQLAGFWRVRAGKLFDCASKCWKLGKQFGMFNPINMDGKKVA